MLEDIAILTGGQVISEELGLDLKEKLHWSSLVVLNLLKFRKRIQSLLMVKVTKMLSMHVSLRLKKQIEETTSDFDKEKLTGKTC